MELGLLAALKEALAGRSAPLAQPLEWARACEHSGSSTDFHHSMGIEAIKADPNFRVLEAPSTIGTLL